MMENCPDAIKAMEEGNCLFGTVDTWLIWVRERKGDWEDGGRRDREGERSVKGGRERRENEVPRRTSIQNNIII